MYVTCKQYRNACDVRVRVKRKVSARVFVEFSVAEVLDTNGMRSTAWTAGAILASFLSSRPWVLLPLRKLIVALLIFTGEEGHGFRAGFVV